MGQSGHVHGPVAVAARTAGTHEFRTRWPRIGTAWRDESFSLGDSLQCGGGRMNGVRALRRRRCAQSLPQVLGAVSRGPTASPMRAPVRARSWSDQLCRSRSAIAISCGYRLAGTREMGRPAGRTRR
jgi:hypothetical protein